VAFLLNGIVERDPQTGLPARTRWIVFVKNEGDCTSEMGPGQFSIFGAIEEKKAMDVHGSTGMKQPLRNGAFDHWMVGVFDRAQREEKI